MEETQKKGLCSLRLEKVEKSINLENNKDFTIKQATFSILDFETSGNKQRVTKEECEKAKDTLLNKPLLCQYIQSDNEDVENPNDDFGDHGEEEITLRDGNEYISASTHAIGTCVNVYVGTVKDENDNDIECLLADFILWFDRYPNEILLINDFYEKGEILYSSCEYYYTAFSLDKDGIELPKNITFSGHTILGSRSNKIEPSYQSSKLYSFNSKWNKAINSLNKTTNQLDSNIKTEEQGDSLQSSENLDSNKLKQNNNQKEDKQDMENKFLKALNELSVGDLRSAIITSLGDIMTANEYENMWISNYGIFSESKYFIYETYEDSKWVNYKVTYSLGEGDSIVVDYASKEKVEGQYTYVSVNELQELETSKNALTELEESKNALEVATSKIEELTEENKSLNEKVVEKSNNSKVDTDKYNELTDKVISLNSLVVEMQPIVDKYNAEVFEKSLNKANEDYKKKFESVNALDTFDEESTQELIKQSINSDKVKANEAKYSLNELIVNSIKPVETKVDSDDILENQAKISINQVKKAEDTKELTDVEDNVLSEFGFNY